MKSLQNSTSAVMLSGVFLCCLGLYFWVENYYPQLDLLGFLNLQKNWPVFLVIVGFYLIVHQYNHWQDEEK